MKNNDTDKQKLMDAVLKASGGKLDKAGLDRAVQSKNADALIKNLSDKDKEKLNKVLSDKESMAALLNSPQAKALMKAFMKNG